jgi:glycosyltransferase involved in cell wall biosynthesis
MQRVGHNPTVITYEPNDVKNFNKLTDKLLIKRYSYRGIPVIALRHAVPAEADGSDIFHPAIEEAAEKLALKCDLVHVCHPMWMSSVAAAYKKHSIPTVMTLTDAWFLCPSRLLDRWLRLCNGPEADGGCTTCNIGLKMRPRIEQAKIAYNLPDEISSPSRFIPKIFERNGWSRSITVIPHGVNYANVKSFRGLGAEEATFGYIGSIAPEKGVHVLVKAVRSTSNPRLKMKIYGSPDGQRDYYETLLDLAGGDDRIQFMGHFEDEELPEIMSNLSALVIPSTYYENYPFTMLTGLAYRLPTIASNIGGMPELIRDGLNGFLFEMGDYIALANIMERIVRKPAVLNELKANIATPRRTEEEALDYENIYRRLVDRR